MNSEHSLFPPHAQERDLGPHEAHVGQLRHHLHDAVQHVPRAHTVVVDHRPAPARVVVTVWHHHDLRAGGGGNDVTSSSSDVIARQPRVFALIFYANITH